jgi:hypothetical protein
MQLKPNIGAAVFLESRAKSNRLPGGRNSAADVNSDVFRDLDVIVRCSDHPAQIKLIYFSRCFSAQKRSASEDCGQSPVHIFPYFPFYEFYAHLTRQGVRNRRFVM